MVIAGMELVVMALPMTGSRNKKTGLSFRKVGLYIAGDGSLPCACCLFTFLRFHFFAFQHYFTTLRPFTM